MAKAPKITLTRAAFILALILSYGINTSEEIRLLKADTKISAPHQDDLEKEVVVKENLDDDHLQTAHSRNLHSLHVPRTKLEEDSNVDNNRSPTSTTIAANVVETDGGDEINHSTTPGHSPGVGH